MAPKGFSQALSRFRRVISYRLNEGFGLRFEREKNLSVPNLTAAPLTVFTDYRTREL